jgi:MtfA peptidase
MRFVTRRRSGSSRDLTARQFAIVVERFAMWRTLATAEQDRLTTLTATLVNGLRWEAARGFAVTDEMRVVIAAHAALPVLELGLDAYSQVSSVIVHPSTIRLTGPRPGPVAGLRTDGVLHLEGQAHHRGPVLLAWDAVDRQSRHPQFGQHVVIHEFAHRLDMLDGTTDGTPPIDDAALLARWVAVCTREFEALQRGEANRSLRFYGATNAGEFFAVATEAFFCRPIELRDDKRELYGVMAEFYRQDPAARTERMPA